jgi:hypothetical protein
MVLLMTASVWLIVNTGMPENIFLVTIVGFAKAFPALLGVTGLVGAGPIFCILGGIGK